MSRVTDCCGSCTRKRRAHRANWMDCSEPNCSTVVKRNSDLIFPTNWIDANLFVLSFDLEFYLLEKGKKWNELPLFALRKRNNSIKIPNYLRRGNSSDPNSSRILRERTWNEKYKKCERMGIARVTVFLQFNGSCALPSPPRYPVQRAIFTSGYLQLSFENSGRGGRKKGREERAGIEVAVIKKSGKLRAGSIRFGGKKGIDEGKKLFRNGNNGGWNAFLREMRLQEAAGEQRFLITISNSDTPENICTPRFLSSIKDCYIGAKIVLEFRVYFENRFNLLFYM